ncbi:MAG: BatD family protein [Spirochaeta sp.]
MGASSARRFSRPGLVAAALLLLCTAITVPAQVQAPIRVTPAMITEGDVFQIRLSISDVQPDQVDRTPVQLPSGLQLVESYVESSGDQDQNSSYIVRLRALRSGFFELPALRVSAAGREMSSGAVLIQVHPAGGGSSSFEASWEVSREQPVAGEAVLITLVLQTLGTPVFPDDIRFTPPNWGDFQEVSGVGDISRVDYTTGVLYQVPVLTYIATPASSGEFTIPRAVLSVGNSTVRAPDKTLTVGEAPSRIARSGGVGDFQYVVVIEPETVFQGESVEVSFRIEGHGNLPYIQLPTPTVENLLITAVDEREKIQPTEQGFTGFRSKSYRLSTRDVGSFQIQIPEFAWYSPGNDRVIVEPAQTKNLQVLPVPLGGDDNQQASIGLLREQQVARIAAIQNDGLGKIVIWLLPAALALGMRKFLSARAGRALFVVAMSLLAFLSSPAPYFDIDVTASRMLFQDGRYQEAYESYRAALERNPRLPGLLYNTGIAAYHSDQPVQAVHLFRKAIQLRPDVPVFREALAWVENEIGLDVQVSAPSWISSRFLLIIFVLAVNGMAMLWLFFRVRRMGWVAVLFLCLGIGSTALLTASVSLAVFANTPAAVLHQPEPESESDSEAETESNPAVAVYRIPVENVDHWMWLSSGTAVNIVETFGEFYLVETGPGVQGWVRKDSVLLL